MVDIGSLTAQPLDPGRRFNWIFLVELIVSGILTLFFLFYFNRLFATLVSYGIRAYSWHKYHVYIDIQALQISLLGGRVFFKGVRYHGKNETILIQHGFVTWNYWLRNVKQTDYLRFAGSSFDRPAGSKEDASCASDPSATGPHASEAGAAKAAKDLPCRISVSISGFEWFVYNRSPVYEAIAAAQTLNPGQPIAHPAQHGQNKFTTVREAQREHSEAGTLGLETSHSSPTSRSTEPTSNNDTKTAAADVDSLPHHILPAGTLDHSTTGQSLNSSAPSPSTAESYHDLSASASPWIFALFPILIQCQKGAIVVGNENTPVILTTCFDRSTGLVDAAKSSPRDRYRQLFDFEVVHPIVRMRPNPDYRQSQQNAAQNAIRDPLSADSKTSWWKASNRFLRHRKRRAINSMRNLVPYFRGSVESFQPSSVNEKNDGGRGSWPSELPGESRWLGLSRYLDDYDRDDHEGWSNVDYARFSNIVDCPSVHFNLYWDVPGPVQADPSQTGGPGTNANINLAKPPAYGLDLTLRGGNINYGPWADRARAELQGRFFPNAYQDAVSPAPLPVGTPRQSTMLAINIHLENETSFRIPTRETSKDRHWKGHSGALRGAPDVNRQPQNKNARKKTNDSLLGPEVRPFGWFAIAVGANSTITYNMDLVARKEGYRNELELDLKGTRMTTSVNHALLWTCGSQKITCNLSNPFKWNSLHSWSFDVQNHDMELFLLRDHVFLLTDLINDFTSGPAGEFLTFVPFLYHIKLSFSGVKLFLNANDSNIIDSPCDVDENNFLVLSGEHLDMAVDIPLEDYAPVQSNVDFKACARDARLDASTAVWNTAHSFASDIPTATLKDFSMDGSYRYFSSASADLTDTVFLNLNGTSPRIHLLGSLIRQCIKLKDNYGGDDVHFRTLEEYQTLLSKPKDNNIDLLESQNQKRTGLDVILGVVFDRVCVLLPANIYSRKENLRLDILFVEADVRFTNYYMDLEANFSPMEASWESNKAEKGGSHDSTSNTEAFVDGIAIYGHRLFGAAPSEPTYVCNWDFDVGKVTGDCSTSFLRIFLQALRTFAFTFDDDENALPPSPLIPFIHDITFLRANIEGVNLWFVPDETAILFEAGHLAITFDDWAGQRFSERLKIEVPDLRLAAVDYKSALRHQGRTDIPVRTHALFELSVLLRMVQQKKESARGRALQQQHVFFHDQRTRRTTWLLDDAPQKIQPQGALTGSRPSPPTMPIPAMPAPLPRRERNGMPGLFSEPQRRDGSFPSKLRDKHLPSSDSFHVYSPSLESMKGDSNSTPSEIHPRPLQQSVNSFSNTTPKSQPATTANTKGGGSRSSVNGKTSVAPKASKMYSSPWTSPSFRLQDTVPDCRELPEKPYKSGRATTRTQNSVDIKTALEHSEDSSKTVHTRFDVDLGPAVRAFATPSSFSAFAALLQALEPVNPTDLLDDLQMSTLSRILSTVGVDRELIQKTDVCVRIPFIHLRMLNSTSEWQKPNERVNKDQYDLQLSGTQLIARSKVQGKHVDDDSTAQNGLSSHLVVRRGLLEVRDRSLDTPVHEAAARVSIEDTTLWMVSDGQLSAKFQQRALELTSRGSQIEFLASLIERTRGLLDSVVGKFVRAGTVDRVERLVYHLTDKASGVADPLCLNRPSYVLRIAHEHLRLHDSWKILLRLRHMLHSLDRQQEAALLQKATPNYPLPPNAKAMVLANFDDWRSWDLAHVKKALIMEKIWQRSKSVASLQQRGRDISFELTLETAKLLLNPGPQENRIDIHNISATLSTRTLTSDGVGQGNGKVESPRALIIETYCSRFGIFLNRDFLELVGTTAELYTSRHGNSEQPILTPRKDNHISHSVQQLQIFAGTDSGMVTVNGINVALIVTASGLSGSVLHQAKLAEGSTTSFLLRNNSVSAKLRTDEKLVLDWLLDNFTLCLSQAVPTSPKLGPTVLNAIGKCEALRFELKDEICSCLQVADCVIRDEVKVMSALLSQLSPMNAQLEESPSVNQQPKVYAALLLDQYSLGVSILPPLTHTISGSVVRTSILPRSPVQMAIEFDLGKHSHVSRLKSKSGVHQVVELDLPLINGRVVAPQKMPPAKVEVETTVDKVELDARSVRACIDMVNRPEVVRALLDARKGMQQVSLRWRTTTSSERNVESRPTKTLTALLYAANLTFIGLRVHASAPALKAKDYRADLEFVFGLTTVHVGNEGPEEGLVYNSPQFDVAIRLISLKIHRRSYGRLFKCGSLDLAGEVTKRTKFDDSDNQISIFHASSNHFDIFLREEIACVAVDIAAHLQERIKSFTLTDEARRLKPLRRLTIAGLTETPAIKTNEEGGEQNEAKASSLFDSLYSVELHAIKVAWRLDDGAATLSSRPVEDLLLSIQNVKLDTRREGSATLAITKLQLQMAPKSLRTDVRSSNSALMPDMVFKVAYLSTKGDRRLAFQAAGKALDLRLASDFILPACALRASLAAAHTELREGSASWAARPASSKRDANNIFSSKYLASLLIDADFAGAVVKIQASGGSSERQSAVGILKTDEQFRTGAYNQPVSHESAKEATLRAPGVAMKIEYSETGRKDPALNAEIKVAASSNVLYPSVVPLIIQISSSVKEIMGNSDDIKQPKPRHDIETEKSATSTALASSDPVNLMGRCKLNLGLWIREQEFSLSCQPIARVTATARSNHIFMALNTVASTDQERFFALSVNFSGFHASVQHVYSRESTASFEVDSVVLSMMNSKHVSTTTGVFAVLNFSPMKALVNAKQLQDFLLFREIWYPAELRQKSNPSTASTTSDSQAFAVQRYQQVAAAGAFPWNAVVSIQELELQLDLGQGLGKSIFTISKVWASAKKASDFEQNLCLGFDKVLVESTGRMSGFVELRNFRIRTSIRWPQTTITTDKTPLVQASLGLEQFRAKVIFDYQPFVVAEISKFNFLMYNVSGGRAGEKDRLVGNLEGEKVQVFCTTAAASQAYGLYQAAVRLNQENEAAYQVSLKDLEKHLQRKCAPPDSSWDAPLPGPSDENKEGIQRPFFLHTDVVVVLQAVNVGIFPSTFFDNQIFKIEAKDAQARFAVSARDDKTQSSLGLTLGQLCVALSIVNRINTQALGEVSVSDIVNRATHSRGGTILKVPKAIAAMQTWQGDSSDNIDYTFKSTFEGKVDVGWNYSRISFIRSMWETHSRALAARLGKPLPQSAVQITGGPQPDSASEGPGSEKITAVVNVPQSRYEYRALEPPVMETPQLRDMGEATPPLEWIGLHRDKLPHVTHQIIIVPLLEVAKKVEDAYSKILGSSSSAILG